MESESERIEADGESSEGEEDDQRELNPSEAREKAFILKRLKDEKTKEGTDIGKTPYRALPVIGMQLSVVAFSPSIFGSLVHTENDWIFGNKAVDQQLLYESRIKEEVASRRPFFINRYTSDKIWKRLQSMVWGVCIMFSDL